jgi:hypothetical protein
VLGEISAGVIVGPASFCDSYHQLLDCIESKLGALSRA